MARRVQGLGKARYRAFITNSQPILKAARKGFFVDLSEIRNALELELAEIDRLNENEPTSNWQTIWIPRALEWINNRLAELYILYPDIDEETEEEEPEPEFLDENDNEVIDEENCGQDILEGIPLIEDCNRDLVEQIAVRRRMGFFDLESLEGYIQPFRHLVVGIEIINDRYYIWVSESR